MNETLTELGFSVTHHVQGRSSIVDLFSPRQRCGIYVLHLADGMYYCGQAKDVTRRYVQHRKKYSDIVKISFKRVAKSRLDAEEEKVIHALEAKGFPLRNITYTSIPQGPSAFDEIMSVEAQERWLNDLQYQDGEGNRFDDPDMRKKYSKSYQRFEQLPRSGEVVDVLREYVRVAIPAFKRGEAYFWSCTCLPPCAKWAVFYTRVNVYWQEVFNAYEIKPYPYEMFHKILGRLSIQHYFPSRDLWFSVYLAKSPLEKAFGPALKGIKKITKGEKWPALWLNDHRYRPGGQDQMNLRIRGRPLALKILQDEAIVSAIRLFNLRLSKKGTGVNSRSHCLDLVDKFME